MKYFDTFSGIGGFPLGIQLAYENNRPDLWNGIEDIRENMPDTKESQIRPTCIGYSEIDKYASAIYQKHFPTHHNYGDITKINADELPDFDLLVGGFPCQAFSIAGKRGGFEDTRGTMFFELARILKAKQPRLFVFENVKGLLSHDGGKSFATIIQTLDELGYDCQWQVLNSKNHGVPQNRERVFIIGHLRGTPRPQVFPFGDTSGEDTRNVGEDLSYALDASYAKGTNTLEKGRRQLIQLNQPTHSNDRVYDTEGISPTLNTMQGGMRQPFVATRNDGMEVEMDIANSVTPDAYLTSGKRGVDEDGKTKLTSMYDRRIRRLTPTETERLQGFPDGWTQGISDTQRYKCCGNAVTVNVIRDIFERII
jgi:DNA (cytosine-5)-methyltransferase 1